MKSIIYVGMDVHKASFTLSCFSVTTQETFATVKISPDAKAIKKYLDGVSLSRSEECEFIELQALCYISAARSVLTYLYFFISAVPVCHA